MSSINCDIVSLWNNTMEKLKMESMTAYTDWFCKTTPLCVNGSGILQIGVPDDFFRDWLKEHFSDLLESCLKACGYDCAFEFIEGYAAPSSANKSIEPEEVKAEAEEDFEQGLLFANDPLFAEPAQEEVQVAEEPAKEIIVPPKKVIGINNVSLQMHTFRSFIAGEENRMAYETIKSVALKPGTRFNPLYIYGGTGVGKTHLLQAVAQEAISNNPRLTIRYTSCEALLNEFINLLQDHKSMYNFRSEMRDVDIFLVDDVHTLKKSPRLQEEFFNTFNTLYQANKQIILTSDKQPCEIEGLEDRLVSRFESGLTQEINPPEYSTRLAILRSFRNEKVTNVNISDDVLEFIAANITSSVRRLKGAILRVITYSSMKNTTVTPAIAEDLLSTLLARETAAKAVSMDDIQRSVADYFNVKLSDILGSARPKNIAEPRMAAMYLCRKLTNFSLPEIGASFGKNHATVINAMKKVPEICEKSEDFKRSIMQIERQLTRR